MVYYINKPISMPNRQVGDATQLTEKNVCLVA